MIASVRKPFVQMWGGCSPCHSQAEVKVGQEKPDNQQDLIHRLCDFVYPRRSSTGNETDRERKHAERFAGSWAHLRFPGRAHSWTRAPCAWHGSGPSVGWCV